MKRIIVGVVLSLAVLAPLASAGGSESVVVEQQPVVPMVTPESMAAEGATLRSIATSFGAIPASKAWFRAHQPHNNPVSRLRILRRVFGSRTYLKLYVRVFNGRPSLQSVWEAGGRRDQALREFRVAFGVPTMEQMWSLRDADGDKMTWRGLTKHQSLFNPRKKSQLDKGEFKLRYQSDAYYRPYVEFIFSKNGVLTDLNVRRCLNSIWGESRGNPKCIGGAGNLYYGLLQFGPDWTAPYEKKLNPFWSINRMAITLSIQGMSGWGHWVATYGG